MNSSQYGPVFAAFYDRFIFSPVMSRWGLIECVRHTRLTVLTVTSVQKVELTSEHLAWDWAQIFRTETKF